MKRIIKCNVCNEGRWSGTNHYCRVAQQLKEEKLQKNTDIDYTYILKAIRQAKYVADLKTYSNYISKKEMDGVFANLLEVVENLKKDKL